MGTFGMDRSTEYFGGMKCESVDESICHSVEDKMSDMKYCVMEPKHEDMTVDSYLGLGMENMGIGSKMEEFSHGFDFSFLPDYGELDSCCTLDVESDLKLENLDGFLDEVEQVEDIYASPKLSSIEIEVKKKVSESDGDPYGLMNFSSKSFSPGISGSIRVLETVQHTESQKTSSRKAKDMLCFHESEDDKQPLSTFLGSWVKRGNRRKNQLKTSCTRLYSSCGKMSCVSYEFRPRRGLMKKCTHTSTENTLSDDQQTSSESEDDISIRNTSKSRSDRRKQQRMWTVDEVVKLVDGIAHFGVGKWTDIKNHFFHSASYRTPIDIRDKWRNLLKASYSDKHNNDGEAIERRKSVARPIPKDILQRVRELSSLHPYPFPKSLSFAHAYTESRSTSTKKKKRS